jgi:hypothetical protein
MICYVASNISRNVDCHSKYGFPFEKNAVFVCSAAIKGGFGLWVVNVNAKREKGCC